MRLGRWSLTAFGVTVLVVDQVTKEWIRRTLRYGDSIPVIDGFFHIVHARNPGGAFSFLAGAEEAFRLPFFLIASVVAIGAILYYLWRVPADEWVVRIALSGLLAGAVGNSIDRLQQGYVTDFLDFAIAGYHWPAFNVADSCISVGVIVLLLHSFLVSDGSVAERDPRPRRRS